MTHSKWICATGGLWAQLNEGTVVRTLPLVLVAIEQTLGISHAEAGTIPSMRGLFIIIGAIVWGISSDRIELRKLLTISSLMAALGMIGMGTINSLTMGLVFYSLIGFAVAAPLTLSSKLIGIWFEKKRRGMAQSYIQSTSYVWEAVLGILIPIIMLSYDWRAVWYILGGLSLFFSGLVFVFIGKNPAGEALKTDNLKIKEQKIGKVIPKLKSQKPIKNIDVLKIGFTWHLGLILALSGILMISAMVFLATYLITEVGLSLREVGVVYTIFSIASMIGGYALGFISDRISRKYVITTISILFGVFLLALINFGNESVIIYILVAGMGLTGGTSIIVKALVADYFPINILGTASGLVTSIGSVGSILGPLIVGNIATVTGSFIPAFQLTAIIAFVLAALALTLKRPNLTD